MGGSDGRIWIFIATTSQHPSISVIKHARRCADNYGRARSRPNYTDDFSNEFEMRPRIDGLLFPIGKICRRIVAVTPRSRAIHLRLSVRRCIAGAGDVGELRRLEAFRDRQDHHIGGMPALLMMSPNFAVSDAMNLASASGPGEVGSAPCSTKRAFSAGSLIASASAL